MVFAVVSFMAVFVLLLSLGLLLFYREAALKRISEVINPRPKQKTLLSTIQQTGFSLGSMVEQFEKILPRSKQEVGVVHQRLIRAGYRGDSAINIFYGCKVVAPLVLCAVALVTGLASISPFFVYALCLAMGFLLPDFWLGKKISARQKRIRKGLPDVLDLIVICVEAGLSLDQATARTASELKGAQPDLCEELRIVVLEQRAGRARADAWKHMAERTAEESLRNLVSMLVQSEQFGTSVAKTLRTHADTLRTQRVQAIEEMAAKTSVKLVFPLVLFIFPALFLVVLGPAMILMMDSFKTLLNQ